MRPSEFLEELKRRRVYRVSAAYLVAVFAVLQGADLILEALPSLAWLYRALVILSLAAFPVVVGLAWVFDITPAGVRRTDPLKEDAAKGRTRAGWKGRPLLVVTILIGSVGLGAWFAGRRSAAAPPVDASATLAVLPFASAAADPELQRIGRELVVTLSHSLAATAGLDAAEPLAVLATVDPEEGDLPPARARAAAEALGAANLIRGAILRADDELRLEIGLYDSRTMEQLGASSVSGGRIDRLTEAATIEILRMIWADSLFPVPSPGAISTGSTEALQAYLEGERAVAEGRWREAPEAYSRAVAADSSFGAAYARLYYALAYHDAPIDSVVRARTWELRHQLPEGDRMIIEARFGPVSERLRILQAVTTRFPTHWPAWWALADVFVHQGGYLGYRRTEARAALERTLALNPRFVTAWTHLFWMASRDRDPETMARVLDELSSVRYSQVALSEAGINTLSFYEAQHALVVGGDEIPDEPIRVGVEQLSAFRGSTAAVRGIATGLVGEGFFRAQVRLGNEIIRTGRATAPMERAQQFALTYALAGLGMWREALESADRYAASADRLNDLLVPYRVAVVGAWLGEIEPEVAAARGTRIRSGMPPDPDVLAEAIWLDGVLAFASRDASALARAQDELASGQGTWKELLVGSLDAFAAALDGDSETAGRRLHDLELQWAEQGLQHSYGETHPFLNGVNRLGAARWLLAAGDTVAARRLLRWHEVVLPSTLHALGTANQVLATPALRIRAELARAAGSLEAAADFEALLRERRPLAGTPGGAR